MYVDNISKIRANKILCRHGAWIFTNEILFQLMQHCKANYFCFIPFFLLQLNLYARKHSGTNQRYCFMFVKEVDMSWEEKCKRRCLIFVLLLNHNKRDTTKKVVVTLHSSTYPNNMISYLLSALILDTVWKRIWTRVQFSFCLFQFLVPDTLEGRIHI